MRIGVKGDGLLESFSLATGLVPESVVEVLFGLTNARVLVLALELGVFDALQDGPLTAEAVAEKTGCAPSGVRPLLSCLQGFGHLKRRGESFRLTRSTRTWLTRGSRFNLVDALLFGGVFDELLNGLESAVRTGVPGRFHEQPHSELFWRRYMRGLGSAARLTGAEVVRRVKLDRPPLRSLDVGGGHGMYSAAFCQRYPELQAEVLDLPEAAVQGQELVAELGLSGRVRYRQGDLRSTDWGEGYDLLLLFNILHNLSEADCLEAVKRARRALRPGGTVLILDGDHRGGAGPRNGAEGFGELFFFVVSGSATWSRDTYQQWLQVSGYSDISVKKLLSFPHTVLVSGRA